jgi:hypothetical protein
MTDPEREYFLARIRELERSRGRWRSVAFVLGAAVLLPVVCGGLLGIAWVPRLERERAALEAEMDRAVAAERMAAEARLQAERARADAERQRAVAEEQRARIEQAKPEAGKDKD